MTVDSLISEALKAKDRFWFIDTFQIKDRTDTTITLHFSIYPELFVQIFFSERSKRFSLALIGRLGRLYGRDYEHGSWHLHPFGQTEQHIPMPEGMSPQPLMQFLAEVEQILVANDLL